MTLTFIHSPPSSATPDFKAKANQLRGKISPNGIAAFCLPSLTFMQWKVS